MDVAILKKRLCDIKIKKKKIILNVSTNIKQKRLVVEKLNNSTKNC